MSKELEIERLVVGVYGLGKETSLGHTLAKHLEDESSVDEVILCPSRKESIPRAHQFINSQVNNSAKYAIASPEELAEPGICDIVFFCLGGLFGAAKGNLSANLPPDYMDREFNGNIAEVNKLGKEFGIRGSTAKKVVMSNPTDLLAFYMDHAYWQARGVTADNRILTLGFNETDGGRIRKYIEEVLKTSGEQVDDLIVHIVGRHAFTKNEKFEILAEECEAMINGRMTKLKDHLQGKDNAFAEAEKHAMTLPKILIDYFGSTSSNTACLARDFIRAFKTGRGTVTASTPILGSSSKSDEDPSMSHTIQFERGEVKIKTDRKNMQSPKSCERYDAKSLNVARTITHLETRRDELEAHLERTGQDTSITKNPKFFRELVVPVNYEGDTSQLFFLDMTEPFERHPQVRTPVNIDGTTYLISNVIIDGKPMLALSTRNITPNGKAPSITIIDPADPGNNRRLQADEGNHYFNSCCVIDNIVYAAATGKGLYQEWNGELIPVRGIPSQNFKGHVLTLENQMYHATLDSVVEQQLRGKGNMREFKLPLIEKEKKICGLHHIKVLIDEKQQDRILTLTRSSVYSIDPIEGTTRKIFDTRVERLTNYNALRSLDVAFMHGDYRTIATSQGRAYMIDVSNGESTELNNISGEIEFIVPDPTAGLSIISQQAGYHHLFRHDTKGNTTQIELEELDKNKQRPGKPAIYKEHI